MTPCHHLKGQGCPRCRYEKASKTKTKSFEEFESEANIIHDNKYRYVRETYSKRDEKTKIICPIHGEFWQTPGAHLAGQGCPKCGREKSISHRTSNAEEFIEKARKVHGDKYDYSKVDYINNRVQVCIICPNHGEFGKCHKII